MSESAQGPSPKAILNPLQMLLLDLQRSSPISTRGLVSSRFLPIHAHPLLSRLPWSKHLAPPFYLLHSTNPYSTLALTADFKKAWLPLSSVSPLCKFKLSLTKEPGLMFESPIPACHSQQKTPTTLSLRLRFWDVILSRKRILEFQCPYSRPLPGTAAADGPPVPPDSPAASLPPPTPRPRHAKPDLPREVLGLRAVAAQGERLFHWEILQSDWFHVK
ncbi:uncharacterized protein LOC130380046 [Gadus chalcogrammus]|uniref:uncharacterized protein LOC130380046 n=1 Tax=Gadus chalcogrammus TaxID=1042646 RepID=UPI0024C28F8F|nr:uncharacterized protein LOC130380046 [Gadus chalcogrammus]